MKNLDQAEGLLTAATGKVAQLELGEERAHILRVRAERAVASGDLATAQKLVAELEQKASAGASINTQRVYHGAAGMLLVAQKQYADAIPQLEEDIANPVSMKILITAYRETGDADEERNLSKKLLGWKVPSVEEALAANDSTAKARVVADRK